MTGDAEEPEGGDAASETAGDPVSRRSESDGNLRGTSAGSPLLAFPGAESGGGVCGAGDGDEMTGDAEEPEEDGASETAEDAEDGREILIFPPLGFNVIRIRSLSDISLPDFPSPEFRKK